MRAYVRARHCCAALGSLHSSSCGEPIEIDFRAAVRAIDAPLRAAATVHICKNGNKVGTLKRAG
jgi:hypothetical protein